MAKLPATLVFEDEEAVLPETLVFDDDEEVITPEGPSATIAPSSGVGDAKDKGGFIRHVGAGIAKLGFAAFKTPALLAKSEADRAEFPVTVNIPTRLKDIPKAIVENASLLARIPMVIPRLVISQIAKRTDYDERISARIGEWLERQNKAVEGSIITEAPEGAAEVAGEILGGGGGSLALAMGVTYATKSPTAAAVVFGELAKAQTLEKGEEMGADPQGLAQASDTRALWEGSLEFLGLKFLMGKHGGRARTATIRLMTEPVQETGQSISEALVEVPTFDPDRTWEQILTDMGISALGGLFIGGGATSIQSVIENRGMDKMLTAAGIDPKSKRGKELKSNYIAEIKGAAGAITAESLKPGGMTTADVNALESANVQEIIEGIPQAEGATQLPDSLQFDDEVGEVTLPETLEFEEEVVAEVTPEVAPEPVAETEEEIAPEAEPEVKVAEGETEAPSAKRKGLKFPARKAPRAELPAVTVEQVAKAETLTRPVLTKIETKKDIVRTRKVLMAYANKQNLTEKQQLRIAQQINNVTTVAMGEKVIDRINTFAATEVIPKKPKAVRKVEPKVATAKDALRFGLKKAQKAAREGFNAGWREARTALNIQMKAKSVEAADVKSQIVTAAQELPASEKGRILGDLARIQTKKGLARVLARIDKIVETSEQKRAQGQLKSAVKKATKKLPELRPEFKPLIGPILNALDPSKPTPGTLHRLLSRQQFLEANPDTHIPEYALREIDRLSRKPIANMTADEADATRLAIESLIAQDRLKRKIVSKQWERERVIEVKRLVEAVSEAEDPTEEVRGTLTRGRSRIAEVKRSFAIWNAGLSRMNRILTDLDGGEPGPHTELFWRKVSKATNTQQQKLVDKQQEFVDTMQEQGIRIPDLSSKLHNINENLDLYSTEKIEVFLATQDSGKLLHMVKANSLTEQDIQDVVDSMTEDELFVANYFLKEYADYYPELAEVHLELTQQSLPQIEGYSPILFDDDSGGTELDLFDEVMTRAYATSKATVERGFTKERTGGERPIRLDAVGNYLNNIQRFERYKAFALPLREMTRLATDQTWRDAVRAQENGDVVLAEFDKWLVDAAGVGPAQVADKFGKAMNWLRRNTAVSKIGLNVLSGFRAGISMFHSVGHGKGPLTLWYHTTAMARMTTPSSMVESWTRAREILPELKLRFSQGIDRELREIAEKQRTQGVLGGKLTRAKGVLNTVALFHYKVADGVTVTISTLAHYNQAIAEGLTHEQATNRAREAIEQTQPMGDVKDLPGLWRGSPMSKLFTMFQNMINQEYNILFRDIPATWKTRKPGLPGAVDATGQMMWAYAWSKLIPGFFLSVIARGRLPKKDELTKDMLLWHILPIWPLGPIAVAISIGRGDLPIPSLSWFRDLVYGFKAKKWATRFKSFARALTTILGIPWGQPQRTVKGIIDLATEKTDLWRRLIWSEYAMREPKPPVRRVPDFKDAK